MQARAWQSIIVASAVLAGSAVAALGADCRPMLDDFNRAIEAGLEAEAQKHIDKIAVSAECGRYQVPAQLRLAALRLSAAQLLMARGRPVSDYERLLTGAEAPEVLWQASATIGAASRMRPNRMIAQSKSSKTRR